MSGASSDESSVFSVTDYEDVQVTCSHSRWAWKIEENRPELSERLDEVRRAIQDPELVLLDRDYPDRKHHVRVLSDGLLLKVVVEYRFDSKSEVVRGTFVTAFLLRRLREGDGVLYTRART